MVWATFWAIFFTNSSGHPAHFRKLQEAPRTFGVFHSKSYASKLTKQWFGLHFGRFFFTNASGRPAPIFAKFYGRHYYSIKAAASLPQPPITFKSNISDQNLKRIHSLHCLPKTFAGRTKKKTFLENHLFIRYWPTINNENGRL
jgi:hypothetical protein